MNLLPNDDLHGLRVFIHCRRTLAEGHRSRSEGKIGHIIAKAASASLSHPGEPLYQIHLEKDPLIGGRCYGSFYSPYDFAPMAPPLPRYGRFLHQAPVLRPPSP